MAGKISCCCAYYQFFMNIAFWNIRGVLKKTVVPDIRDFGIQNHISIFMLCEIKSKTPPSQSIAQSCGFRHVDFVPTMGLPGGVWLLWKDCSQSPFNLVIIFKGSRFMACSISILNENISFVSIFVYAPPANAQ